MENKQVRLGKKRKKNNKIEDRRMADGEGWTEESAAQSISPSIDQLMYCGEERYLTGNRVQTEGKKKGGSYKVKGIIKRGQMSN